MFCYQCFKFVMQKFIILIAPFLPSKVGNLPKVFPSHMWGYRRGCFQCAYKSFCCLQSPGGICPSVLPPIFKIRIAYVAVWRGLTAASTNHEKTNICANIRKNHMPACGMESKRQHSSRKHVASNNMVRSNSHARLEGRLAGFS